ncbi:MAG: MarR family transcriptional regulator [Candidatus Marinimicrobia bacterium]|jgi:DNA-binding MarR family transcriptional regulator|uniref:Transcriptional regulator, MarR family n=1 Tax=SAR86 cluster bacterium SAR86B TaxID=1123867 RepID=J5KM37_9GAMM|nr:MAG: transcriptional regulator, MarR family [SAR86 cluster bacterium SAR86B]MDD9880563.1 MarR family transcriptional regulator [Candidatus Neomarinimicrobiota bacterium]MDD9887796.1 MarR family transcriptional regulator [Candidatus Neomarinimicrobiota bacterium]MDD9931817.1 MarR family transcriptional regulator [Candidatus Neomarinimicrobiota bacterium]MDP6992291.1 MarR family transcriptional regulator [Candidatus Neomarinimicrobiota bacterium]
MEFGELLKQFLIDLQSLFRSHTKDLKITMPQVMLVSSIPTDGIDMTSLAQQIGVDNSTMTRLIGVLIKDGIVVKKKNPRDGRSMLVLLTKRGESLQYKLEVEIDKFGSDLFRKVPMEDQEEVKEILYNFHWIVSKYRLNE